jgi:hypothetical protein
MDPRNSDQPTLGNGQHFIYTKEHATECMTWGPRAGRTKGSSRTFLMQQTNPQPPSNHLRDQITDAQSKAVKIIGSAAPGDTAAPLYRLLQLPLAYIYPLLQPPTYWGYKLSQAPRGRAQVIRSKWRSPPEVSIQLVGERVECRSRSRSRSSSCTSAGAVLLRLPTPGILCKFGFMSN